MDNETGDYLYVLHRCDERPMIDSLPFLINQGSRFYFAGQVWEVFEWVKKDRNYDDWDDMDMVVHCRHIQTTTLQNITRDHLINTLIQPLSKT